MVCTKRAMAGEWRWEEGGRHVERSAGHLCGEARCSLSGSCFSEVIAHASPSQVNTFPQHLKLRSSNTYSHSPRNQFVSNRLLGQFRLNKITHTDLHAMETRSRSPSHYHDTTTISLDRLLTRLEHTLLSSDASSTLRKSVYERKRVGAVRQHSLYKN